MGEDLKIYVPKCRIHELLVTGSSKLIHAFLDKDNARNACKGCHVIMRKMRTNSCPVDRPGIVVLICEDSM